METLIWALWTKKPFPNHYAQTPKEPSKTSLQSPFERFDLCIMGVLVAWGWRQGRGLTRGSKPTGRWNDVNQRDWQSNAVITAGKSWPWLAHAGWGHARHPKEHSGSAARFFTHLTPGCAATFCVRVRELYGPCARTRKCTGWIRPPMIFHISIQAESK